jgi:hypothetical protein
VNDVSLLIEEDRENAKRKKQMVRDTGFEPITFRMLQYETGI